MPPSFWILLLMLAFVFFMIFAAYPCALLQCYPLYTHCVNNVFSIQCDCIIGYTKNTYDEGCHASSSRMISTITTINYTTTSIKQSFCNQTTCHPKASRCIDRASGPQCICDYGYGGDGINYCDECGLTYVQPDVKIVGGSDAANYSWPSLAYIYFEYGLDLKIPGRSDLFYQISAWCGGSLIDRNTVLTAAHCISTSYEVSINGTKYAFNVTTNKYFPTMESMYTVYLGAYDLNNLENAPTEAISVAKIIPNAYYSRTSFLNDIALFKLSQPVTLNEYVQIACLPNSQVANYPALTGLDAYIAGWGDLYGNSTFPDILQNAKITIYNGSVCSANFEPGTINNWNLQICAGNLTGGVDTCQGDSGGALYIRDLVNGNLKYVAAGLVSYGFDCAKKDLPGVYTRVSAYSEWINYQKWLYN